MKFLFVFLSTLLLVASTSADANTNVVGGIGQVITSLFSSLLNLTTTLVTFVDNILSQVVNLVLGIVNSLNGSIVRSSATPVINTLISQIDAAKSLPLSDGQKTTLDFVKYLLKAEISKLSNNSIPLNLDQELLYIQGLQQQIVGVTSSIFITCGSNCTFMAIPTKTCQCYTSPEVREFLSLYFFKFLPIAQKLGSLPAGTGGPTIGANFFTTNGSFYFYIYNNYGRYDNNTITLKLNAYKAAIQKLSDEFNAAFPNA